MHANNLFNRYPVAMALKCIKKNEVNMKINYMHTGAAHAW